MRLRNILGGLVLSALTLLPFKAKAEEFKPYSQVSASVAAYKGTGEGFSDIYGVPVMLGCSIGRTFTKNLRIQGDMDYISQDGVPFISGNVDNASCHMKSFEIDGSVFLLVPLQKGNLYAGGGLTRINFQESMQISGSGFHESDSMNESAFGFNLKTGIELNLGNTWRLFGQFGYKSAKLSNGGDVGGSSIGGGARLRF